MNDKGKPYEDMACVYLQKKGYRILCRNYACPYGEIDLIARDGKTLVFVEVKYRKSAEYGHPLAKITPVKQQRMWKTANWYLMQEKVACDCRFDGIGILGESISHIENIF